MKTLCAAILICCCCAGALPAQQLSERETIAQCRRELELSSPVEMRRRSAMVVGKYLTAEASALLAQCLDDPDADVRRNALVSIGEEPEHLRADSAAVLRRLKDPDVNIRRLASSLIPQCLGVFIAGAVTLGPGVQIRAGGALRTPALQQEIRRLMDDGLADADAEVRRNVLYGAQFFGEGLSPERIAPFLKDSSSETVVLAITAYLNSTATSDEIAGALAVLGKHPDVNVRQAVAAAARQLGTSGCPLLRQLCRDEDAGIQASAVCALARFEPNRQEHLDLIEKLLKNPGVPSAERAQLVNCLDNFSGPQAQKLLKQCLQPSAAASDRLAAWRLILSQPDWKKDYPLEEIAHSAAGDAEPAVRALLLNCLRRSQAELTPEILKTLQDSAFTEMRMAVLELSGKLPLQERQSLVKDALLDDDQKVRVRALQLLPLIRPDGWVDDLLASLEDENPAIAENAAMALMGQFKTDPRVIPAIRKYLPNCRNATLKQRLEARLK